jgi:small GTP-binding protein
LDVFLNLKQKSMQPTQSMKTVIIGNAFVGKTCLLIRFTKDFYEANPRPTRGVDFSSIMLETASRRPIELQLWDTAGTEIFESITQAYYRHAVVGYFVFDLTKRESVDAIGKWVPKFKERAEKKHVLVLIGNKADLSQPSVRESEARSYARAHGMRYFTCSAKTGDGVVEAFRSVLTDSDLLATEQKPGLSIVNDPEPSRKCC